MRNHGASHLRHRARPAAWGRPWPREVPGRLLCGGAQRRLGGSARTPFGGLRHLSRGGAARLAFRRRARARLCRRPRARERGRSAPRESLGFVIDTSALVDLEREGAAWEQALGDLANEPVVLPAIVYGELLVGV